MRIAVNTRLLIPNKLDGMGWFAHETLRRITVAHPEHEFIFLFDRKFDPSFIYSSNVRGMVVHPQARHPFLWYLWLERGVAPVLKQLNPDLFLSPDGFLPLYTQTPCLTVIHDINFHHRPQNLPFLNSIYHRKFFPCFALKARRIATVSNYSANDIASSYGIDKSKIDVLYNGVNSIYEPLNPQEIEDTRALVSEGAPYFLYVGSLIPRKNLVNLLKAFDLFAAQVNDNSKLVLVGKKYFRNPELDRTWSTMKHANRVVFLGRKDPGELRNILGSAMALTFVPFFEGFGIPLLEAMQCDIPIIASRVTSLPEVAGKAALWVNPESVEEIADAMKLIYSNSNLRKSLIVQGREQRKLFSWSSTAQKLWLSIDRCLSEK